MTSCLGIIIALFSDPYDYHFDTNEIGRLLEMSGSQLPYEYVSGNCDNSDLYGAHEFLINETQARFFARSGERQDAKIPAWIVENTDSIKESTPILIETLTAAKLPKEDNPKCVGILGATKTESGKRIDFLERISSEGFKSDKTYLLTGKRLLFTSELTKNEEMILKDRYSHELTEADMMDYVYRNKIGKAAVVVNALPCNLPLASNSTCSRKRPNTEDTIEAFLDINPNCGSVSFISRAPNIAAQYEAIAPIMLQRAHEVKFEIIGGDASLSELPDDKVPHALYHILMPFAGALWGSFERVSEKISELNEQCPANYEYLHALKVIMKKNNDIAKSDKDLVIPGVHN